MNRNKQNRERNNITTPAPNIQCINVPERNTQNLQKDQTVKDGLDCVHDSIPYCDDLWVCKDSSSRCEVKCNILKPSTDAAMSTFGLGHSSLNNDTFQRQIYYGNGDSNISSEGGDASNKNTGRCSSGGNVNNNKNIRFELRDQNMGGNPLTKLVASGNKWTLVPCSALDDLANNNTACNYTDTPESMGLGKGVYLDTSHIDFLMCMATSGQSKEELLSRCECALLAADVNNVTESYLIAAKYGLRRVMDALIQLIRDNFIAVTQTRQFLELPADLVELFMSDTFVNVDDELDVFSTALRWIDYNKQERLCQAGRILNCVRYEKIQPIDIRDYVEPNIHLFNGPCGPEALVNIYRKHALTYSAVDGGPPLGPRVSGKPEHFPKSVYRKGAAPPEDDTKTAPEKPSKTASKKDVTQNRAAPKFKTRQNSSNSSASFVLQNIDSQPRRPRSGSCYRRQASNNSSVRWECGRSSGLRDADRPWVGAKAATDTVRRSKGGTWLLAQTRQQQRRPKKKDKGVVIEQQARKRSSSSGPLYKRQASGGREPAHRPLQGLSCLSAQKPRQDRGSQQPVVARGSYMRQAGRTRDAQSEVRVGRPEAARSVIVGSRPADLPDHVSRSAHRPSRYNQDPGAVRRRSSRGGGHYHLQGYYTRTAARQAATC